MKFADIILPLAIPNSYTYAIPQELEDQVQPGIRVAVQFGRKRKYAGIVKRVHDVMPGKYTPKSIISLLDELPIIHPMQLKFWEWLADYYMCTEGEVMNASLPAHLKLSSETILLYNPAFGDDFESLDDDEYIVAEALQIKKELTIDEVQQLLNKASVYTIVKELIEKKLCLVYEELKEAYKPKLENIVELSPVYEDENKLQELFDELEKAPKQLSLLMAFLHFSKTEGIVKQSDLLKKSRATAAHLKGLTDKNILLIKKQVTDRINMEGDGDINIDFTLNDSQQNCLDNIRQQLETKQTILLHGVTSSGKTMIYVKLIEEYLQQEGQVLYLLPEIALTAQIIRRLQKYFGNKVGVYHSRFNNNERVELWNKVKNGEIKIILGARSALLLPFQKLSLIILDEEQDSSYKQQDPAPRYHARDAAIYYATLFRAKVLLGSATPSLESYYNAEQGKYGLATLPQRHGNVAMPEIIVVDSKQEERQKKSAGHFTSVLKDAITETLSADKQVILFQNRRGYAPYQVCSNCGWIPHCDNCDVALTYHKYQDKLQCHYCGRQYPTIHVCAACGSQKMVLKSFGTEKIEDDLHELFPDARVARMDWDAVRTKEGHHKLIQLFEQRRIDILVGTQMIVKGLDFEHVSLVGILQADNLWSFPDFRVNERAFQLMEQVSGRAGRKDEQGKVIIQAYNVQHPVLEYVKAHDYQQMYADEIQHRREFGYPPFLRLIRITLKHKKQETVADAAHILSNWLQPSLKELLAGPAIPFVGRVRNYYLQEMLIRLPKSREKITAIKLLLQEKFGELLQQKSFKSVVIQPDVDPI